MTEEEFERVKGFILGGFMYVGLESGYDVNEVQAEFDAFIAECERRGAQRALAAS